MDEVNCPLTWSGERGYINDKMLKKYLDNLKNYTFYVAGPPGLVSALISLLRENKVLAEKVKYEEFSGY